MTSLDYARALAEVFTTEIDAVAVMVHGSVAFGDAVPGRSDLDLLIVGDLPQPAIDDLAARVSAVPVPPSCRGLEASVVSAADLHAPNRPFRAHFNFTGTRPRVDSGYGHPGDPDLTLHYAVARARGLALHGTLDVLPDIPPPAIAEALLTELTWASANAAPHYTVLNAARALAYARERVLLSKLEGWLWCRRHDGPTVLLDRAVTGYLGTGPALDAPDGDELAELLGRAADLLQPIADGCAEPS